MCVTGDRGMEATKTTDKMIFFLFVIVVAVLCEDAAVHTRYGIYLLFNSANCTHGGIPIELSHNVWN